MTQSERLAKLETETRMSVKVIKEDIGEIKNDVRDIKCSLAPLQEMNRRVIDHHKDLKMVKESVVPAQKQNTNFRESLEKAGCPVNKVHMEDLEDREKARKKTNWLIISAAIALLGILVGNFQMCDRMTKFETQIKSAQIK